MKIRLSYSDGVGLGEIIESFSIARKARKAGELTCSMDGLVGNIFVEVRGDARESLRIIMRIAGAIMNSMSLGANQFIEPQFIEPTIIFEEGDSLESAKKIVDILLAQRNFLAGQMSEGIKELKKTRALFAHNRIAIIRKRFERCLSVLSESEAMSRIRKHLEL